MENTVNSRSYKHPYLLEKEDLTYKEVYLRLRVVLGKAPRPRTAIKKWIFH